MGKKRKRRNDAELGAQFVKKQHMDQPMPEGVFHYHTKAEVPWDTQQSTSILPDRVNIDIIASYWKQRYQIFSKYDEGIWMTDDAWYGVTQELVARVIADNVSAAAPDGRSIIVDAFCGAGGNTIAFALSGRWKRVYAIEKDAATLECAKNNAKVYGVYDQITWFLGDCFELLGTDEPKSANAVEALRAVIGAYGVIFASPPWGGPGYRSQEVFDLETMEPYTLRYLVTRFSNVTKNMALYLPRTSDVRQIAKHTDDDKQTQIYHYCTSGNSRALCAYLGDWKTIGPAV